MELKVEILRTDENFFDLPLPRYSTKGSAGMDIVAAVDSPVEIAPGEIIMVSTAVAIALPHGYECQVRSRSGLAAKHGIFALNSPGTIDSDYRGEVKIILANFGKEKFIINRGDRIAQLVVAKYEVVEWSETDKLEDTMRGDGGFGSTGV